MVAIVIAAAVVTAQRAAEGAAARELQWRQ
jgi:hypothetical protein